MGHKITVRFVMGEALFVAYWIFSQSHCFGLFPLQYFLHTLAAGVIFLKHECKHVLFKSFNWFPSLVLILLSGSDPKSQTKFSKRPFIIWSSNHYSSLDSSPLSTALLLLVILWPHHAPKPLTCTHYPFCLERLLYHLHLRKPSILQNLLKCYIIYETFFRPHVDFPLLPPASIITLCHRIMVICFVWALQKQEAVPWIFVAPEFSP